VTKTLLVFHQTGVEGTMQDRRKLARSTISGWYGKHMGDSTTQPVIRACCLTWRRV